MLRSVYYLMPLYKCVRVSVPEQVAANEVVRVRTHDVIGHVCYAPRYYFSWGFRSPNRDFRDPAKDDRTVFYFTEHHTS